jgi:hypothetical protein
MLVFKWPPRLAYLALFTFVTSSLNVASAAPAITLDGPMTEFFSLSNNPNEVYSEPGHHKYGAWVDGPMNPYKYGENTFFQIPHSEIFRIKVPGNDWGNPTAWTMEGAPLPGASITPPQRDTAESHYNNRNWMFSVYAQNGLLYGITHHEWYKCFASTTLPGFKCDDSPFWATSIGWAKSSDGGSTWSMRPVSEGASRLIVAPEPSSSVQANSKYGFMHPSNVVKEGNYYYIFTSTVNYDHKLNESSGVALFRTDDISKPVGWQFWNGDGWTLIDHSVYQGNFGSQMPHVFQSRPDDCNILYAMNVRQHRTSGKWIVLGSKWCLTPTTPGGNDFKYQAVFSWVNSLDNPRGLDNHWSDVQQNGFSLGYNCYYSFFDVDGSTDDNYQSVGDNPLLVVTNSDSSGAQDTYYSQHITLTGFVDLPTPNVNLPAMIINLLLD